MIQNKYWCLFLEKIQPSKNFEHALIRNNFGEEKKKNIISNPNANLFWYSKGCGAKNSFIIKGKCKYPSLIKLISMKLKIKLYLEDGTFLPNEKINYYSPIELKNDNTFTIKIGLDNVSRNYNNRSYKFKIILCPTPPISNNEYCYAFTENIFVLSKPPKKRKANNKQINLNSNNNLLKKQKQKSSNLNNNEIQNINYFEFHSFKKFNTNIELQINDEITSNNQRINAIIERKNYIQYLEKEIQYLESLVFKNTLNNNLSNQNKILYI